MINQYTQYLQYVLYTIQYSDNDIHLHIYIYIYLHCILYIYITIYVYVCYIQTVYIGSSLGHQCVARISATSAAGKSPEPWRNSCAMHWMRPANWDATWRCPLGHQKRHGETAWNCWKGRMCWIFLIFGGKFGSNTGIKWDTVRFGIGCLMSIHLFIAGIKICRFCTADLPVLQMIWTTSWLRSYDPNLGRFPLTQPQPIFRMEMQGWFFPWAFGRQAEGSRNHWFHNDNSYPPPSFDSYPKQMAHRVD